MSLRKSPIRTPALLAANRANAHKSTEPRTAEGKRRVGLNGLRHGGRAGKLLSFLAQAGATERASLGTAEVTLEAGMCLRFNALQGYAATLHERRGRMAVEAGMCLRINDLQRCTAKTESGRLQPPETGESFFGGAN